MSDQIIKAPEIMNQAIRRVSEIVGTAGFSDYALHRLDYALQASDDEYVGEYIRCSVCDHEHPHVCLRRHIYTEDGIEHRFAIGYCHVKKTVFWTVIFRPSSFYDWWYAKPMSQKSYLNRVATWFNRKLGST